MMQKEFSWALGIQKEISTKLITHDTVDKIENICGIDISYRNETAYCSGVITNTAFDIVATINIKRKVEYPYIPGLFFLRESGPILKTLALLKDKNDNDFDVLLIDGHGVLHPRKCGLASYIGYSIDKPTIGVAKSLLCGSVKRDHFVEYNETILGYEIKKRGKRPTYISAGHKISLKKSIQIVENLTKDGERLPEPLKIADLNSKNHFNFV
jgi:deoxyribonuclease V